MDGTDRHRPKKVVALLVGEAVPADGQGFYDASSNLFRATHAAFALASGDEVPDGEAFVNHFAGRGWWQVNLQDVDLPQVIATAKPKQVVVVKASIARDVERAVAESGVRKPPSITVLRYPIRQWRNEYVTKLAELIAEAA